ncbi:MAG: S8 family serine peptidase [Candidatus Pacearchaeota archaeon]
MLKKLVIVALVFALAVSFVSAGEVSEGLASFLETKGQSERVDLILLFNQVPGPSEISTIKSDGASVKYQYGVINGVSVSVPKNAVDRIVERPFVESAEMDYEVSLVLDESVPKIRANEVWDFNITGEGINVAVFDTGIYDEHSALSVDLEIDYTGEGTNDLHGHGTHVAGIVASNDEEYKGVAPGANLFNVKVLNQEGVGYSSDIIEGLDWALENGADIASMSFGAEVDSCDGTDVLSRAVDSAVDKGLVVVIAAGNSGPDSETITIPGCSQKGIAVGASDNNDNVPDWSSRGPTADGRIKPDVLAPGVSIISTRNDGEFAIGSGTSASTPHVSGLIALLLQEDSSLTSEDLKDIFRDTSIDLGLDDNTQGFGRVDAFEAYAYVANVTEEDTEGAEGETEETNETEEDSEETEEDSERVSPGTKPGDVFYGIERLFERIGLALTFDPLEKAKLHVRHSEERLAEAEALSEKGDLEGTGKALEDYERSINNSIRVSETARGLGENTSSVDELVAEATSTHLRVLGDVYNKVPDVAKPSIERAIEASARGRESSINAIRESRGEGPTSGIPSESDEGEKEDESETEEDTTDESSEPVPEETEAGVTGEESDEEKEDSDIDEVLNGLENPARNKIKDIQDKVKSKTSASQGPSSGSSGNAPSSPGKSSGRP